MISPRRLGIKLEKKTMYAHFAVALVKHLFEYGTNVPIGSVRRKRAQSVVVDKARAQSPSN
jgi:hypothetical protein